jgi:antitoxin StbD
VELFVQLTEARNRLSELVREVENREIWVLRHGKPVVVFVAPRQYEALLNEIEDLRDRLSIYESEAADPDLRIPWDKAKVELGLD